MTSPLRAWSSLGCGTSMAPAATVLESLGADVPSGLPQDLDGLGYLSLAKT
jgi:hypothetical protein